MSSFQIRIIPGPGISFGLIAVPGLRVGIRVSSNLRIRTELRIGDVFIVSKAGTVADAQRENKDLDQE